MNQQEIKQEMFEKFGWTHGAVLSEELWKLVWEYSREYSEHEVLYYMSDFDRVRTAVASALQ